MTVADVFVGRDIELRALAGVLDGMQTGGGCVVLASGEPGIGKTRLIDELVRMAEVTGFDAFVGRCYEIDGAPAFWPWIQVLRGLVRRRQATRLAADLGPAAGDLAALVPELVPATAVPVTSTGDVAVARFHLFDGVATLLRRAAADRPIVLALDDLHRADTPSLRLLEFLAPQLRDLAVVILGTFRDSPHDLDHPLASTLGELGREASTLRLPLRGLTREAVGELLGQVTGAAAAPTIVRDVHARTEGNPLFVTEIARRLLADGDLGVPGAGREHMSAEMRATIGRHVAEASPACVAALTAAAVYGREFRIDALARMTGTPHDALDALLVEAARRQLTTVAADPRRARFTHVLTRDVLYDGIPAPERPAWHRRAGEALAAVTAGELEPPLAELAAQFGRAGDPRAIDYASAAGSWARGMHAFEEAAEQFAVAVAAAERATPFDPHRHCDLLLDLGEAQRDSGAVDVSKRTVLRAMESARHRGAYEQRARAAFAYGVDFEYGEGAVVDPVRIGLLAEAIDAAGTREDAVLVRLLGRMALARLWDASAAADRDVLTTRAVTLARRLGDAGLIVEALLARHLAIWTPGNSAERLAIVHEAQARATPATDPRIRFKVYWLEAATCLETNDLRAVDAALAACARIAETSRYPSQVFTVTGCRAMRAAMQGDFAAAAPLAASALELGLRWFPDFARVSGIMLAMAMARRREDWASFEAPFRVATQAHPGSPTFHALLALTLCELGRPDEARAEFNVLAASDFAVIPDDVNALLGYSFAADVCAQLGDVRSAAHLYRLLEPHREANGLLLVTFTWRASIAHRLGVLARLLGRFDEATTHFEDALTMHANAGAPVWLAITQYEYARLLHERGAAGDGERAAALLDAALATATRLGLEPLHARIMATRPTVGAAPDAAPNVFRRDGEYWTITFTGTTVRLRNLRGLEYLAQLLVAPGRERHVTELIGTNGDGDAAATADATRVARDLGDAGPLLDGAARAAYRQRLQDLREELASAERMHDLGRSERVREETAALLNQLDAAGRGRVAASHAERARQTVTKRIKEALVRIATLHPELGAHLGATVRRGYFCVYLPDPQRPIDWQQ